MDVKINAALVKKLREEGAWSQEHLASVAGLSLRTIQRIETDGNASAESRMAIASALGIDVAILNLPEKPAPAPTAISSNGCAAQPKRPVLTKHQYRVLVYMVFSVFFVLLDISKHGTVTWSEWPVIVWGLVILLRWIRCNYVISQPRTKN